MRSLPLLLVPALSACSISWGHSYPTVDGVRLRAKHVETLELEAFPAEGLTVESALGDVRAIDDPGATRLEVEVFETAVGDGHAALEGGRLVAVSVSGGKVALGAVTLRTHEPLARLELRTEMGDLEARGIHVQGELVLATGMGDVVARDLGELETLTVSSGMGDVELSRARPQTLEASSGMGDVEIAGVAGRRATLSSGMGDVSVADATFDTLAGSTGMGDVDCKRLTCAQRDLHSGLGDVTVE